MRQGRDKEMAIRFGADKTIHNVTAETFTSLAEIAYQNCATQHEALRRRLSSLKMQDPVNQDLERRWIQKIVVRWFSKQWATTKAQAASRAKPGQSQVVAVPMCGCGHIKQYFCPSCDVSGGQPVNYFELYH
jgi:hypothetical protein